MMQKIIFFIFIGTSLALRLPNTPQQEKNLDFAKAMSDSSTKAYDLCHCTDASNLNLRPRQEFATRSQLSDYDITLVTTSVGEHDRLEASLRCNKAFVNQMIVITHDSDKETQRVCDKYGARCHVTNAFYANNASFNKGLAMSEVQAELHREAHNNSVVMLIDSDICLPTYFPGVVPVSMPEGTLFSAVERCMYETPEAYSRGFPATQAQWSMMTMGFLQMYRAHSAAPLYPTNYTTAGGSDMEFGNYFKQLKTLPFMVTHMGLSPDPKHWKGHGDELEEETTSSWATATLPPEGACPCCIQKTEHCWLKHGEEPTCNPITAKNKIPIH